VCKLEKEFKDLKSQSLTTDSNKLSLLKLLNVLLDS